LKYLLDTNVVSDIVQGVPAVKSRLLALAPASVGVSLLTLSEIAYGLERNEARAAKIRPVVEALIETLSIVPFEREDAESAGRLRAELERVGKPIGPYDVLIAGNAIARRLILVTANAKEFSRVPGLYVENWRR
jgi:tRNA(fMet)-specific endonuclease VapC